MSSSDVDSHLRFVTTAFAQHEQKLRRFIRGRLASGDALDDLVQEVWRRLLQAGADERIEKPLAYLLTAAKSVLADHYSRTERDRIRASVTDGDEEPDGFRDDGHDRTFEQACSLQMLEAILNGMPRHHAQILVLRLRENLSYRQISEKMGFTPSTVERYFFAAIKRARCLRDELEGTSDQLSLGRTSNMMDRP